MSKLGFRAILFVVTLLMCHVTLTLANQNTRAFHDKVKRMKGFLNHQDNAEIQDYMEEEDSEDSIHSFNNINGHVESVTAQAPKANTTDSEDQFCSNCHSHHLAFNDISLRGIMWVMFLFTMVILVFSLFIALLITQCCIRERDYYLKKVDQEPVERIVHLPSSTKYENRKKLVQKEKAEQPNVLKGERTKSGTNQESLQVDVASDDLDDPPSLPTFAVIGDKYGNLRCPNYGDWPGKEYKRKYDQWKSRSSPDGTETQDLSSGNNGPNEDKSRLKKGQETTDKRKFSIEKRSSEEKRRRNKGQKTKDKKKNDKGSNRGKKRGDQKSKRGQQEEISRLDSDQDFLGDPFGNPF